MTAFTLKMMTRTPLRPPHFSHAAFSSSFCCWPLGSVWRRCFRAERTTRIDLVWAAGSNPDLRRSPGGTAYAFMTSRFLCVALSKETRPPRVPKLSPDSKSFWGFKNFEQPSASKKLKVFFPSFSNNRSHSHSTSESVVSQRVPSPPDQNLSSSCSFQLLPGVWARRSWWRLQLQHKRRPRSPPGLRGEGEPLCFAFARGATRVGWLLCFSCTGNTSAWV